MTDDLVKRLRDLGDHASYEPHMYHVAASRIEQLESALREISKAGGDLPSDYLLSCCISVARAALGEKKDG